MMNTKAMADQFIGKVLTDKYKIDSLISEDNLGNFYHGTHLLMEKPVAVKTLSPALAVDETIVKRFANEARTVSRISHPNILNVTDYGSDKSGAVFIVYEDAAGETLKEVIERAGKFSLERANNIVKQVASALSVAHANGIVHQDLTSENILVRRTPTNAEEVKVLNFYIPFSENEFDVNQKTLAERAKYISPELINGTNEADERADVYSLGIIIYEMLAGEAPFTAENPTDILLKQAQNTPPPLSAFRADLPNDVNEVLSKALAKKPELRYQTVNTLADSFNRVALLAEQPPTVAVNANPAANNAQNNIWKTAFIVLAGIGLMSVLFIYMTTGKQTNPSTQLQTDANGQPVQPLNPSTGTSEQTLANMTSYNPDLYSNSNINAANAPGGVSNPYWDSGKVPPGAPQGNYSNPPYPVYPSNGTQVYVDPGNGSIFMPNESGNSYVMVPKNNANANTQANTKAKNNANTNTQPANTAKPTPTPSGNTATPSQTPAATKPKATPKPTVQPKNSPPPSATEKRPPSGKEQDTN